MAYQATFKRYELKYLLSKKEKGYWKNKLTFFKKCVDSPVRKCYSN